MEKVITPGAAHSHTQHVYFMNSAWDLLTHILQSAWLGVCVYLSGLSQIKN
jgi:hypothetical protein